MLKIKDNVDLKELEKFGFKKVVEKDKTYEFEWGHGKEDYYTEILYRYNNGINTIDIVEERINSDWNHSNQIREVFAYDSDYDMDISKDTLSVIYDLIKADLIEKVGG